MDVRYTKEMSVRIPTRPQCRGPRLLGGTSTDPTKAYAAMITDPCRQRRVPARLTGDRLPHGGVFPARRGVAAPCPAPAVGRTKGLFTALCHGWVLDQTQEEDGTGEALANGEEERTVHLHDEAG